MMSSYPYIAMTPRYYREVVCEYLGAAHSMDFYYSPWEDPDPSNAPWSSGR